jgi:hypothetical protein
MAAFRQEALVAFAFLFVIPAGNLLLVCAATFFFTSTEEADSLRE